MLKRTLAIAALAMLATTIGPVWAGADSTEIGYDGGIPADVTICGSAAVYDLTAGQTLVVGTVTVANDDTNLYVTYELTNAGDSFGTLHLWAGTDLTEVDNGGASRPAPGQLPYFGNPTTGTYTFEIPLADIPYVNGQCDIPLYVVTHAEVDATGSGGGSAETAFGGDEEGDGNSWWYYSIYTIQCCTDVPPTGGGDGFETAFAYGTHVFTKGPKSNPDDLPSLELTRNRWGWALNLTDGAEVTQTIYAGAGLNDTAKGTAVGTATFSWDGSEVTVTYDLDAGYTMEEVHVYAGDDAPDTIAPGQYGHVQYFDPYETSYTVTLPASDTDGDGIWVIAHAVVFGTF